MKDINEVKKTESSAMVCLPAGQAINHETNRLLHKPICITDLCEVTAHL